MKSFSRILSILVLALLLASCKHENNYTLEWDLSGISSAGYKIDSVNIVDGTKVLQTVKDVPVDGKLKVEGYIAEPTIATLQIYVSNDGEKNDIKLDIILEEGNITFNPNYGCAQGTPLNDKVLEFFKVLYAVLQKDSAKEDVIVSMYEKYITEHKDDISSVFVLASADIIMSMDKSNAAKLYSLLSDSMKETTKGQEIKAKMDLAENTSEGHQFTDFTVEYNGKVAKLSDYVGKGKLCLVDFWASWCGPCRAEIPNIIKVFEKYGDKVNVLGVASWDKPEDTQKAIEELGIKYPQIINAQSIGTDAYGIEGIPEIILFSPDGKILKRGLREDGIMQAIEENL